MGRGLAYLRLEEYGKAARVALEPVMSAQGRELFATAVLYGGDAEKALRILQALGATPGVMYLTAVAELKLGRKAAAAASFARLVDRALGADKNVRSCGARRRMKRVRLKKRWRALWR